MNPESCDTFSTVEVDVVVPGERVLRGICFKRIQDSYVGVQGEGNWLFLHGWLDNASSFERLVPALFDGGPAALVNNVLALDMAGHGKSHHRGDAYHLQDFAADAIFAARRHFGPSAVFNLLGHSLGGGVCMLVAGTVPDQVARLVLLESAGPFTGIAAGGAPSQLRRAVERPPSLLRPTTTFRSVDEAAELRAAKNVVEDKLFTADSARVLLRSRGLKPAPPQKGNDDDAGEKVGAAERSVSRSSEQEMTWSTDPWLLRPTRVYLTEACVSSFASSITAPTLILLARDGMFKRFEKAPFLSLGKTSSSSSRSRSFKLSPFHTLISFIAACVAAILGIFLFFKKACGRQRSKQGRGGKAEAALKAATFLASLGPRIRKIKNQRVVALETGGHHPHLCEPEAVAAAILSWASTPTATRKGKEKSS